MARIIPNQNSWIGFAGTIATLAAPTIAEINNAVDLTAFTVSMNASMRGNVVAVPDFSNKFESSIDGTVTGTFEADFYRDSGLTTTVTTPTGLTATPVGTGGTFAAATYYWKVSAVQGTQESLPSTEASAAIVLNGSASLAWTAVPGATGYRIYRANASGGQTGATQLVAQVGNQVTYTDTGTALQTGGALTASNLNNDIAWNVLPRGTGGYFLVSRFGGGGPLNRPSTAGNKLEVWPVRIVSRSMANLTNNTAETFTVTGAINAVPAESAVAT